MQASLGVDRARHSLCIDKVVGFGGFGPQRCKISRMTTQKRLRTDCKAEITGKKVAVIGASRGLGLEDWAQSLKSNFGPVDYAFVVAGVVDGYAGLRDTNEEKMLYCFKTNTIGPLLIAKELVANGLLKRGSVLANMTSKMGSLADNTSGGTYAYRASKSALNQVTKSLAIDLEPQGITVSLLHPGWVRTDITGGSGLIDADQSIAGLLSVLESDLPLHGHWYDYKHEEIPW